MPHPCVVCGRSRLNPGNKSNEYIFFGFPVNDEERCKKWLEFCCREDLYELTKKQLNQRVICSKHFVKSEFHNNYYDRLSNNAVPKIYDTKQSLYNICCAMCGSTRKSTIESNDSILDSITFHHFPGEEFRCLKWLDFVGIDSYYRLTRKEILFCYICSEHFEVSQFVPGYKNRLCSSAVPTIKNNKNNSSELRVLNLLPIKTKLFQESKKTKTLISFSDNVLESQECVACGRLKKDPNNKLEKNKFYPFPAYEIGRCLKWCEFLNREDIIKMSPNQIRKLVLCSKHFEYDEDIDTKSPYNAIPTIHDSVEKDELNLNQIDLICNQGNERNKSTSNKNSGVKVSSKKPKVDPVKALMPLAKKRGKSKRPTRINLPNLEFKNQSVNKLPLPSISNWNLQFINNLNPVSIPTCMKPDIILPYTENITPVPVNSLACVPPGILIKVDLQKKKVIKSVKAKKKKINNKESVAECYNFYQQKNICQPILNFLPANPLLPVKNKVNNNATFIMNNNESVTKINQNIQLPIKNRDAALKIQKTSTDSSKKKSKVTSLTRRTVIPIQNEVKKFLHKIRPHIQKLPKKGRARVKLFIVNNVIDKL